MTKTKEDIKFHMQATGDAEALAKIKKAEKAIKKQVSEVRATGESAKKSTEAIGTLATSMGDSQFGGFANQAAQITERLTHMNAGLKEGGENAWLFKAGLVGLTGFLGFKLGKAIGDRIFQTKDFEDQLESANEKAKKLANECLAWSESKKTIVAYLVFIRLPNQMLIRRDRSC